MNQTSADISVVRYECIDSTSAYARREAAAGRLCRHPVVFMSKRQTAGVGRFGRVWESPNGGIWMTLAWPVERSEMEAIVEGLGIRIGVACRRAVTELMKEHGCEAAAELKWPNDVLVKGKKVLGALTEVAANAHGAWVLVGVGLNANVNVTELAEPLQETAGTLREAIGHDVDLERAREALTKELTRAMGERGLDPAILAEASGHLHGVGQAMSISMPDGSRVRGVLIGLDEEGQAMFDVDGERMNPGMGASVVIDCQKDNAPHGAGR